MSYYDNYSNNSQYGYSGNTGSSGYGYGEQGQQGQSTTYGSVSQMYAQTVRKVSEFFTNNPLIDRMRHNPVSDFMTSNDLVYRITFVFFIFVICVIIIKVVMFNTVKTYAIKNDVLLINGTIDAQSPITIPQSINNLSTLVVPSRNRPGGLEFTWSVWIYIKSVYAGPSGSNSLFTPVFFKGGLYGGRCGNLNELSNGPGLYLLNNSETSSATLYLFMDTFAAPSVYAKNQYDSTANECDISNAIQIPHIPVGEWIHVCFGCSDRNLDVYINGVVAYSVRLSGIPKQNNGDIYVAYNGSLQGGFPGKISLLRYLSHKLNVEEVLKIYKKGPSKIELNPPKSSNFSDYLSFNWYASK